MEELLLSSDSDNLASVRGAEERVAFGTLVSTYHPDLLRMCYVILGDVDLAEDAAQGAWTRAWGKFHQLRDPGKARSWLIAVAANEARQLARRKRPVTTQGSSMDFGSDASAELLDLADELARLSPEDRRLLGLRYALDLTSAEIGGLLGLSAGAVRHRLMRLLERMREEMK